jgi:uncharacterized damage-inducible protein DinB
MPTIEETNALLATLEQAPELIVPLVREVPDEQTRNRPPSGKWSVHEHACHLAEVHSLFTSRLDRMLAEDHALIETYSPPVEHEDGALLERTLESELRRFGAERRELVARLRALTPRDWERTADHPQYSHYTLFIMFRHMALHDHLHAYRIEEILLEPRAR